MPMPVYMPCSLHDLEKVGLGDETCSYWKLEVLSLKDPVVMYEGQ